MKTNKDKEVLYGLAHCALLAYPAGAGRVFNVLLGITLLRQELNSEWIEMP